ncbi:MAG TPA: GNAT family N-acetyltransferase [Thermoanaerobaculia bacterium]|nr:GNAT family N-acetyltransferase [Thermoanaerobaculia bacterium]
MRKRRHRRGRYTHGVLRTAVPEDLPPLRDLARRANDAPYDLETVLEEKCFGAGVAGKPSARIFESEGAIRGVAVTCGRFLRLVAVDREHRRRGIGTALLRDSNAEVIGAEGGNYFTPGVADSDGGTMAFFRRRGYRETAATWNLHAEIEAGASPGDGGPLTRRSATLSPLRRGEGIDGALMDFVRREFGPVWAFEVSRARSAFWIEQAGFAVIEANNRGLGTFGPAGVAKGERGKGHGRALLLAALEELARLGHPRAIIPWTDAFEFYRKSCGAEPAHRFVTFTSP